MRIRRTSFAARPPAGYTIIELLVALSIAAIFFTSFFAVVATTMETLRTGDERTVAQQNARIAMSTLMAELRGISEIEPRSTYEAGAPPQGLPGLPRDPDAVNRLVTADDAWPLLARSSDDSVQGYIVLNHRDAPSGDEQYAEFRDDGRPFDLRPLCPNRLTVRLGNAQYFGNTAYTFLNPVSGGGGTNLFDIDASGVGSANVDNATTTDLIVSYEHQITPPRVAVYDQLPGAPSIYDYVLDGLVKRLYVMSGSGGTPLILDTDSVDLASNTGTERPNLSSDLVPDFYLLRSFYSGTPPNINNWTIPPTIAQAPSGLGTADRAKGVYVPPVHLRQPLADHIMDLRFRYWFSAGSRMYEIRYDPNLEHAAQGGGGMPDAVNNGYYRYFDESGNEMFVWSKPGTGKIDVDEAAYFMDPQQYFDDYESSALICTNEFERGFLMFEGWRLISAISVTLRAANDTVLGDYVSSIDFTNTVTPNDPEWGFGFTDFGGSNISENMVNPLYRAADNYRGGFFDAETGTVSNPADVDSFDIIEPLASTNFDPTRFVTLESMITPPALQDTSKAAQRSFRLAFSAFKFDIE